MENYKNWAILKWWWRSHSRGTAIAHFIPWTFELGLPFLFFFPSSDWIMSRDMPNSLQTLSSGWPRLLLKLSIHFFLFIVYSISKISVSFLFFRMSVSIVIFSFCLYIVFVSSLSCLSVFSWITEFTYNNYFELFYRECTDIHFGGASYCKIVVVFGSVMFYSIFCLSIYQSRISGAFVLMSAHFSEQSPLLSLSICLHWG